MHNCGLFVIATVAFYTYILWYVQSLCHHYGDSKKLLAHQVLLITWLRYAFKPSYLQYCSSHQFLHPVSPEIHYITGKKWFACWKRGCQNIILCLFFFLSTCANSTLHQHNDYCTGFAPKFYWLGPSYIFFFLVLPDLASAIINRCRSQQGWHRRSHIHIYR